MYSPSVGFVGTVKDVFITSDSEGALISPSGLWNIMGAGFVMVMFPFGTALMVKVDARMSAGVPTTSFSHHGISGVLYTPIGMYAMAYYMGDIYSANILSRAFTASSRVSKVL
jgi:hypothetical protein